KMSKSKGNTVDPQGLIAEYGADTVRLFIMFAAPPEQSLEWSDSGVEGSFRFLKRLWRQVYLHVDAGHSVPLLDKQNLTNVEKELRRHVHHAIEKVTDDIGRRHHFNTAIATNMELLNTFTKFNAQSDNATAIRQEALEMIVLMLYPIVPHICQELWVGLGKEQDINRTWPELDKSALVQDELQMVVQVNGKVRGKIMVASDASKEDIEAQALAEESVIRFLDGKAVKKLIVVPKKLVSIVV
ncbi:MAG: class I tRNA ligase family protein, partial [Methyloprofundus sp.]|nr:class I tRNA ligase family protein [Methyloprofundus sp.]